ncbi:MAG: hypothetical protein WCC17_16675 [Candidatus Nitrosopolaris sp.]
MKVAGLTINPDIQREHKRFIGFKKYTAAYEEQSKQLRNLHQEQLLDKKNMALERFKRMLNDYGPETIHGSINQDDFQADLVSSGKFYQDTTLFAIEDLIKDCILIRKGVELRLS